MSRANETFLTVNARPAKLSDEENSIVLDVPGWLLEMVNVVTAGGTLKIILETGVT